MGVLPYMLLIFINLLVIAVDIIIFFVVVRLVTMRKHISWLEPFNCAGRPLVKYIDSAVSRRCKSHSQNTFNDKNRMLFAIVILLLVRFVLGILWQVV